jgi:hypothetical protein
MANPGHIDLDTPTSNPDMSSLTKIEVTVNSSSNSIDANSFVIYAVSTLYDQDKYSSILNGFRDNFQLQQPISGVVTGGETNSTFQDGSIAPYSSARNRELTAIGVSGNTAVDFFLPPSGVNNGLLISAVNNPASTIRVYYNIPPIISTASTDVNIHIPYYTWLGDDNRTYTIRVLLLNNSGNVVCKILDTDVKITSDMSYNYIFTEGKIKINPGESVSRLILEIDNVRRLSSTSFLWIQYFAMNFRDYNCICVLENTHILLANGQWKKVQDLTRGELIAGKDGSALPLCRLIVKDISVARIDFIVIPKDAIAPGIPMNDLYCCKHHYFLYGDKLYAAESFLSFPGVRRIRGYAKEVLGKELPKLSKLRMYDLQFETEGFYIAEGLVSPSRSPYDADDPLPRELFFDKGLFRTGIPKSQLDHLMGYPVSFERIAMKAKWNWRKFLQNLKKQGIKVSQETYEEALRLRKSLGHRVKVFELEYEE